MKHSHTLAGAPRHPGQLSLNPSRPGSYFTRQADDSAAYCGGAFHTVKVGLRLPVNRRRAGAGG